MNPHIIVAQHPESLGHLVQIYSIILALVAVFHALLVALAVWVIYKFYARLRDIANELRKLRLAYESAHRPDTLSYVDRPFPASSPGGDESRYMPKA